MNKRIDILIFFLQNTMYQNNKYTYYESLITKNIFMRTILIFVHLFWIELENKYK